MEDRLDKLSPLTEKIIGCAFAVANTLGVGFLEKVYENALVIALRKTGLKVLQQVVYNVEYDWQVGGEYIADLVVEDQVIVELKAIKEFDNVHTAICIKYLKVSKLPLCLLINFGKSRIDVKRIAL